MALVVSHLPAEASPPAKLWRAGAKAGTQYFPSCILSWGCVKSRKTQMFDFCAKFCFVFAKFNIPKV